LLFIAPSAVRHLSAAVTSHDSLFISWKHPKYPNGQLITYIIYYKASQRVIRSLSTDGFASVVVPADALNLTLTGLMPYTNYTIRMSASGKSVNDAPIEEEVIVRTNTSGKSL